ncbi:metallophosphoesterase family protein [Rhizobium terrae]|uniref:metallophosphoesterase family protein n=1 Tax=Rhizobium terrae TaxID=2171756 RepID=UPI000E3C3834|nr:metallophosphoesterase family protein [Rhizobium terrae]
MTVHRRALATESWPEFKDADEAGTAGRRIYAVGDIHGYAGLLAAMRNAIVEDMRRYPADRALVIFLGDFIDRGPDSFEVVEALAQAQDDGVDGVETLCLRGNHDDWLATFLADASVLSRWAIKGGLETLVSYGLKEGDILAGVADIDRAIALQKDFAAAIPDRHREFMLSLPLWHGDGDYFFAHAGVDPDRPLDDQRIEDLTWIRDKFLLSRKNFGKVVVHGHTPRPAVESLPNRINVDTGVYLRQVLSCVILEGTQRHLLQVGASQTADLAMETGA